MGVPDELIISMGTEQKEHVVSNCTKFVGFTKGTLNESTSGVTSTSGGIKLMATIPSSQLDQYFSVYSTARSSDNGKRFHLLVNWKWDPNNMPLMRLTDPFGMLIYHTLHTIHCGDLEKLQLKRWCLEMEVDLIN